MNVFERLAKRLLGNRGQWFRTPYRRLKCRTQVLGYDYPEQATIALTNKCNSLCTYCARTFMVKSGELTVRDVEWNVFTCIVDELARYTKPQNICLAGLGEPLVYPRFFEALDYMKMRLPETPVQLITNGIAMNMTVSEKLVEHRLDRLTISLNSFNPETYMRFNGVDKFYTVMRNLETLLSLKGDKLPATKIQLLDTDETRSEWSDFERFWRQRLNRNDQLITKPFESAGGKIGDVKQFDSTPRTKSRYPCAQLWGNILFTKDGDVYPCCVGEVGGARSEIWIGNVTEQSLKDILVGEKLKRIRETHLYGCADAIPLCSECDVWRNRTNPFFWLRGKWR